VKLTVSQSQEVTIFYGNEGSLPCSQEPTKDIRIHSTPNNNTPSICNSILSIVQSTDRTRGLLHVSPPTPRVYASVSMHATCPVHLMISLIYHPPKNGGKYKSLSSALRNYFQPNAPTFLLYPTIQLNTLFCNALALYALRCS